jgi:hypothetical protein
MGSFDLTCAVSNLPVGYGDQVRLIFLVKGPYDDENTSPYSWWVPRNFPLKAKYNDYASLTDIQTGPMNDILVKGFSLDIVEKGWGDNSYHDIPINKGMSVEELVEAVHEDRLFVGKQNEYSGKFKPDYSKDDGVPSLGSIKYFLESRGFTVNDAKKHQGFAVDEIWSGGVRVRFVDQNYDHKKELENLWKLLPMLQEKYAAMMVAGSGSYGHGPEIFVAPLPNAKFGMRPNNERPDLPVKFALIREDVWQELLNVKSEVWDSKSFKKADLEFFRGQVQEEWDMAVDKTKSLDEKLSALFKGRHIFNKDHVPYVVGYGTHWQMMVKEADKLSKKEINEFLDTAAELAHVEMALSSLYFRWKPSVYGGQDRDFKRHAKLLSAFAKVARKADKEE